MPYAPEEHTQLSNLLSRLDVTGHPEQVLAVKRMMRAGVPFDEIIGSKSEPRPSVRPTRKNAPLLEPPPRTGPGSGAAQWREWIAVVSDIDEEVASRMTRADIILLAEEENIIDSLPV